MAIRSRLARNLCLGVVAAAMGSLVAPSLAQLNQKKDGNVRPTSASPAPRALNPMIIGTIDMNYVINNYDKFKVLVGELRDYAMAKEADLAKIGTSGQQSLEKREKFTPESAEWKKYDAEVTRLQIEFESAKEQVKKDFDHRQQQMMYTVFREIQAMTTWVAQRHEMNMVEKFSPPTSTAGDMNAARAQIAQHVMYADPRYDVTKEVTEYLNDVYAKAIAAGGGAKPTAKSNEKAKAH